MTGLELYSRDEMDRALAVGEAMMRSGSIGDTKSAAAVALKILAGAELGIGPVEAQSAFYVVQGNLAPTAQLLAQRVKRHPRYDYRVTRLDNAECEIAFTQDGEPIGVSVFTLADAEAAGLEAGGSWAKYPRNMLFARAMSNGVSWFCPDVATGRWSHGSAAPSFVEMDSDEGSEPVEAPEDDASAGAAEHDDPGGARYGEGANADGGGAGGIAVPPATVEDVEGVTQGATLGSAGMGPEGERSTSPAGEVAPVPSPHQHVYQRSKVDRRLVICTVEGCFATLDEREGNSTVEVGGVRVTGFEVIEW